MDEQNHQEINTDDELKICVPLKLLKCVALSVMVAPKDIFKKKLDVTCLDI